DDRARAQGRQGKVSCRRDGRICIEADSLRTALPGNTEGDATTAGARRNADTKRRRYGGARGATGCFGLAGAGGERSRAAGRVGGDFPRGSAAIPRGAGTSRASG